MKPEDSRLSCVQRFRFSSLWPFWYGTAVLLVHAYLIYQAVYRYRVYSALWWELGNLHLTTLLLAAILTVPLVLLPFFKLGTYTNDGQQIGGSMLKRELSLNQRPVMRRLWRGMLPISPLLHIIAALLFLLPSTFSIARGRLENTISDDSGSLKEFLDFGAARVNASRTNSVVLPSVALELSNMVFGLMMYTVRFSVVFWHTSRTFSVIFTIQLLFGLILHILSYAGFNSLYIRLLSPVPSETLILDTRSLVGLYLCGNAVLVLSPWLVFHFGYGMTLDKVADFLKRLGHHHHAIEARSDCGAYIPHTFALLAIMTFVAANGPIMYDYVTVYQTEGIQLLIVHLTSCVLYMLFWIILWFVFTIKQGWTFKIQEVTLKKYVILQNSRIFHQEECSQEVEEAASSNSSVSQDQSINHMDSVPNLDDDSSNTSTSTNNETTGRPPNGILSQRLKQRVSRSKRRANEQKVKFLEETRIVETNLDSDLDTIPESDNEKFDSAFGSSGGSSGSNASPSQNNFVSSTADGNLFRTVSEQAGASNGEIILTPRDITFIPNAAILQSPERSRMWHSTGDLYSSKVQGKATSKNFNNNIFAASVPGHAVHHNKQRPTTLHLSNGHGPNGHGPNGSHGPYASSSNGISSAV